MIIGIIGYQGGSHLYATALKKIGENYKILKSKEDFTEDLTCIVMSGGESSVQMQYIKENHLYSKILQVIQNPTIKVVGTCAGMILLSSYKSNLFDGFGVLNIELKRNFYGSQIQSGFYKSKKNHDICFIRAPGITKINDNSIEVLDEFENMPILIRKNNIYATSFHPEIDKNDLFDLLKDILNF